MLWESEAHGLHVPSRPRCSNQTQMFWPLTLLGFWWKNSTLILCFLYTGWIAITTAMGTWGRARKGKKNLFSLWRPDAAACMLEHGGCCFHRVTRCASWYKCVQVWTHYLQKKIESFIIPSCSEPESQICHWSISNAPPPASSQLITSFKALTKGPQF